MTIGWKWFTRFGLVFLLAVGATWYAAHAQYFPGPFEIPALPDVPPTGAWGEVIMANNKWLVVQNHEKQQFPILIDAAHIRQFLVRWPTSPRELTNNSLVEAMGPDLGTNTVQVDHVDVFEGADQALVAPTYQIALPNNFSNPLIDSTFTFGRAMAFDVNAQILLSGWALPATSGALELGGRLHVVGNPLGTDPLRLSVLGNNFATVAPGASGSYTMTQVTYGTSSFLQKGDLVFLVPIAVRPDSLVLRQLILYKKMSRREFAP